APAHRRRKGARAREAGTCAQRRRGPAGAQRRVPRPGTQQGARAGEDGRARGGGAGGPEEAQADETDPGLADPPPGGQGAARAGQEAAPPAGGLVGLFRNATATSGDSTAGHTPAFVKARAGHHETGSREEPAMVLTHGLRGIRVVLAAAIAAGLCACGGDGEVTVPVTEQDALSTPQQVRAHLDFISSQIPLPGATPAVVPGPFLCESAGSRETSADTVDSPFTNPPLDVERVRFHDCMQYNGPPSDPQSSFVRQHGLVESGFAEQKNGTRVSYEGRGESASQPFERQVLDRAEDGVHELDHRFFSRTHQRERLGMFGLLHEVDRRMFVEHQLSILEPDGRRIEGRYRVGTPSGPFIAVARNSTYEIRGQYQIEAARCRTGVI